MNLRYTEKLLLAVFSGLLLTAAFPPGNLSWVAWIAFIPLFMSLEVVSGRQAFTLGLCFGLAHNLTLVYWVVFVMGHYGNLPVPVSLGILLLFAMYLSLYPALFSLLASLLRGPFSSFQAACLWVALEFVRAKALSGFPWSLVAHSQYLHLPVIQIADLVGAYGVSFLILLTNATIYTLIFRRNSRAIRTEATATLLLVALTFAYGYYRLSQDGTPRESLKVALVQGDIDQSIKWDPSNQAETINIYRRLTLSSKSFDPDLVVWPETAVPLFFQEGGELAREVLATAKEAHAYIIFGSPAYGVEGKSIHYYNRAYLISPQEKVVESYDKIHLVPFGEYVPLQRYLPFVHRLVVSAGDFRSGKKSSPLSFPKAKAGILICFESIFPELARDMTKNGAQILVNITNDAWYGMTSAPYQHFSMAVFRAVENRRPLVRAANTGFSAFIDCHGEIMQVSHLFTEATLCRELPLGGPSLTVYTRYGDFFPVSLLVLTLIQTGYLLYYTRTKNRLR
jgi:apolipoprotein N-acyltransferase